MNRRALHTFAWFTALAVEIRKGLQAMLEEKAQEKRAPAALTVVQ